MHPRHVSGHVLRAATFGCVPVHDDEQTRARLNDLCEGLTEALQLEVRPHRAPSPAALASAYRAGRVQLAWVSPTLAASDPAFADAEPLVQSVRAGTSSYFGCLFVRRQSPITSVAGLQVPCGRRASVAWVAPTSAGGYLFPRLALSERGLDPATLFAEEHFAGSHGAVAEAVRAGRADVGATFAVFEGGDPRRPLVHAGFAPDGQGADELRVLLNSRAIPSDLVLASASLRASLSVDPAPALEGLHLSPRAAAGLSHVLGAERFERCHGSDLGWLRERLRQVPGLEAAG